MPRKENMEGSIRVKRRTGARCQGRETTGGDHRSQRNINKRNREKFFFARQIHTEDQRVGEKE